MKKYRNRTLKLTVYLRVVLAKRKKHRIQLAPTPPNYRLCVLVSVLRKPTYLS